MVDIEFAEKSFNGIRVSLHLDVKLVDPLDEHCLLEAALVLEFFGAFDDEGLEFFGGDGVVFGSVGEVVAKLVDFISGQSCLKFLQSLVKFTSIQAELA